MLFSNFPSASAHRIFPLLVFVLGLITSSSCKNENTAPTRMQQVIAIHDSVMPKMTAIGRLVADLKPLADSTEQGLVFKGAMEDLQAAHKSMMDWMKGFGDRFDYAETMEGKELTPEKKEWLKEEEIKVKAMRDQVFSSIEQAQKLLEEREGSPDQ